MNSQSNKQTTENTDLMVDESLHKVKFERVEGSTKILIAGHEFQSGTSAGNYHYWYCKYKRCVSRICHSNVQTESEFQEFPKIYYTIAQKLYILDLVRAGQIFRLHTEFANVAQKQIDDWSGSEQEMRALSDKEKNSKLTLHKGTTVKYSELYQFLYQTVKEMRSERLAVTVDSLIGIARNECADVLELSHEGRISLIRRFMSYFKLSMSKLQRTS